MNDFVKTAKAIAETAHEGQLYDGGPYFINHVEKVAARARASLAFCPMLEAVCYLHDVIEDTSVTPQDLIEARMPILVVTAVVEMTHEPDVSYMEYLWEFKSELGILCKFLDMTENLSNNPSAKNKMKYEMGLEFFRLRHANVLRMYGLIAQQYATETVTAAFV